MKQLYKFLGLKGVLLVESFLVFAGYLYFYPGDLLIWSVYWILFILITVYALHRSVKLRVDDHEERLEELESDG